MKRKLRVGTDCSGIEAPIQALQQLNIPFEHVFSSEIDEYCIKSIKANYEPKCIYDNITNRNSHDLENIDLYVCGFPCQPFSSLGSRKGVNDQRGNIFLYCLDVITTKLPTYFILENVIGLLSIDNGNTFKNIIKSLNDIKKYNVYWKVCNTKDYGIPQSRKRLFIIGTMKNNFEWPNKLECNDIENYIDYSDLNTHELPPRVIKSKLLDVIPKESKFIDLSMLQGRTIFSNSDKHISCILRKSDMYCVPLKRRANIKELLSLQGFINFKQVVSDTQLKKQIGNSMSVNVLKELMKMLLKINM